MAEDDARIRAAVDAEEARLARKLERSEGPRVGSELRERQRLLSVVAEVALDLDDQVADELAVALLDRWPYDLARRAVEVYGAKQHGRFNPDDVQRVAEALAEAQRIADVRARARDGDEDAQVELDRIKEALRRGMS